MSVRLYGTYLEYIPIINTDTDDLTLNCRITSSLLHRSLFIEAFYYWIHRSLY